MKVKTQNIKRKNTIMKKIKITFKKLIMSIIRKKKRNLNKKKVLLIITEILVGTASAVGCSTMGLINPGAGIIVSVSTALLTSIAILISNEYISKLKIRFTKLRDWINVITLLYEKALKTSVVDK